jgi:hypothetical protein
MTYIPPVLPATGTTFSGLRANGLMGMLETLITVIESQTPTLAPTAAATLAASGSGGTLPAATYWSVFTETNFLGETPASPVSASQAITLGQNLVLTFPALQTNNTARKAYVGLASAGPFRLASSGITAGTLTISAPLPSNSFAVQPPSGNGTGLSALKISALRSIEDGNLQTTLRVLRSLVTSFIQGDAVPFDTFNVKLRDAAITFTALAQLCNEVGVLVDANPGTIGLGPPSLITAQSTQRTWP